MIHLKRFLWLAAWSVWVWLGFGLYRELPRDLGPTVYKTPLRRDEVIVGLFDGVPEMVTYSFDPRTNTSKFRRCHLLTGELKTEFDGIKSRRVYSDQPRLEFVRVEPDTPELSSRPVKFVEKEFQPWVYLYVVDLFSGKSRPVSGYGHMPIFHPRKPWAIIWSGGGLERGRNFLRVEDFRAGRRLFQWNEGQPSSLNKEMCSPPFFVGEDRIGVMTVKDAERRSRDDYELEIWSIASSDRPLKVIRGAQIGFDWAPSGGSGFSTDDGGRVAWNRKTFTGCLVRVFDVHSGREIFDEPGESGRDHRGLPGGDQSPILSLDGRSVMNAVSGRLYEVDSGKLLWSAKSNERLNLIRGDTQFMTREDWDVGLGSWTKRLVTCTYRRLSDGSLIHRMWADDGYLELKTDNGQRLAFIAGTLYELPPRVNWSLLILCQTILALPLVLIWVLLRWRRNKKAISAAT